MPTLNVTVDDLRTAVYAIYGVNKQHAPAEVWVDHFDEEWSYLRAIFREKFCKKCGSRLLELASVLRSVSGNNPAVTICIYTGGSSDLAEERQWFVRRRLAGLRGDRD